MYEDLDDLIREVIGIYLETETTSMLNPSFFSDMTDDVFEFLKLSLDDLVDDDEDMYTSITEVAEELFDAMGIPERTSVDDTDAEKPIDSIRAQLEHLQSIDQPPQRTEEWYKFRHNLISASNFYKIFGSEASRNSLIYEKCKPFEQQRIFNTTDSPMHWGQKYEPLSVMIYERMNLTTVKDFGCICHPEYSCIGASPDGINVDPNSPRYGRMLEIKNIVNREITGIPTVAYWVQTQIQMETCGLDECDFLETRFCEYSDMSLDKSDADMFFQDTSRDFRGVILYFVEKTMTMTSIPRYEYMIYDESGLDDDPKQQIEEWIEKKREELSATHLLYRPIYWYLDEYSCVLIRRNRIWFQSAVPQILDTWKTIEYERDHGYEHRASKKRASSITEETTATNHVVKLDHGDEITIHVPIPKQSVCLLKLG